jgi:hypothetical protein
MSCVHANLFYVRACGGIGLVRTLLYGGEEYEDDDALYLLSDAPCSANRSDFSPGRVLRLVPS